jgi:hypothetical protein
MAESVPSLLAKISRYRPRIVCFVGVGIWDIFLKGLKPSLSPVTVATLRSSSKSRKPQRVLCLQEYKVVHPHVSGALVVSLGAFDIISQFTGADTSLVQETLFFVVPSTSGRVVSHQVSFIPAYFA